MAKTESLERWETIPGSSRSASDLGVDGVTVKTNDDGSKHVTLWNGSSENDKERYSYDVDRNGNYIPRSTHYTDNMADVMRSLGHSRW